MRALIAALLVGVAACSSPAPPSTPTGSAMAGASRSTGGAAADEAGWRRLPDAPTQRTEVAAAATGHRIVVAGGFGARDSAVATVDVYDVGAAEWTRGPDLPTATHHAMAAAAGDIVYIVGGYTSDGFSQPGDHAFALRDGDWSALPRLPDARAAGGAAVIDGHLYVAGGVGPTGLATDMLVFDTDARTWDVRAGPPTPREHLGVTSAAGRLYVVGGRTGGLDTNLPTADVFDPATGTWTGLPAMPTARGGVAAAAADGLIIVPGGEQRSGTFATVEALDIRRERWRRLPSLPTPRHGLGVAAVGSVVHVIQGGPQPGLTVSSVTEALDLATVGTPRDPPGRD